MRRFVTLYAGSALATGLIAPAAAAQEDQTLSGTTATATTATTALVESLAVANGGNVAEIDVEAVGGSLQYIGVVLNGDGANAGAPHVFVKVQNQGGNSQFTHGACYTGNNNVGGSFGLGFFSVTELFTTAHLKAERIGSSVTITLTNVDGGAKADQIYVCNGAPAPVGEFIGINGFAGIAEADNFSDGDSVLDTFSYVGPLASSGSWTDAAPGMTADGSVATGGPLALSFYTVPTFSCDGGFLPPFDQPIALKPKTKRAIPVKAYIVDNAGALITDADIVAPPVITVSYASTVYGEVPPNDEDLAPLGSANDDNIARFDPDSETWIYNLGTKQFTASGEYTVEMVSGDPGEYLLEGCSQTFSRP